MADKTRQGALEKALLGCDWYVNTQIINQKPWWDNNHGRYIYTRHMPSGLTVRGICWTQARGIMCCLTAYVRTRDRKYLVSAEQAANYILQLQIMDSRDKRFFGAIHEEIYSSEDSNIRDAAESCSALVMLYQITKKKEYLVRAELWAAWFLKHSLDAQGYPLAHYNLVTAKKTPSGFSYSSACALAFYILAVATRKPAYKTAFKKMADIMVKRFVRKKDCAIMAGTYASHHAAKGDEKGVALNDDGCGIVLLQAYKLLKDKKYLTLARTYGDYILNQKLPYEIYSAHPSRFNFLMDLAHVSGDKRYSNEVFENINHLLRLQYLNKADKMHHGAFRGEDEPAAWYGPKNAKGIEFVNNRMTAYSVMTLFKMDGKVIGPAYSALGW